MTFLERFRASLESLHVPPQNASYVVAYSGGLDSHVLLYCCKKLGLPLRAIHVHHGLQNVADDWVKHCQQFCDAQKIQLDVIYVDAKQKRRQSPEEAARNARYEALQSKLTAGDCLLTAQHIDDQAETLLLQLFRTASSAGLAAMPQYRQLGDYIHIRPLLPFPRKEILAFAEDNGLHWIEDPSNRDDSFDRNFIRNNILPLLENRWPEVTTQLSTVASLQSRNLQVLEDMAAIDLANVIKEPAPQLKTSVYDIVSVVSMGDLKKLSSARLLNVLRYWILKINETHPAELKTTKISPTRKLLEEIEKTLINAQQDTVSVITFSGYECRKFQNDLYLLKQKLTDNYHVKETEWDPVVPLDCPSLNKQIKLVTTQGKGLSNNIINQKLTIRFRKGGEIFHPAERRNSQSLKKLLQEANIPPWDRDTIPLLYLKDKLIAVVGLWIAKEYAARKDEAGWSIEISNL